MLLTILAPEIVLGKALSELVSATRVKNIIQVWAEKDRVPWTLTYSFFADMGGFVIQFPETADKPGELALAAASRDNSAKVRKSVQILAQSSPRHTLETLRDEATKSNRTGSPDQQLDTINRNSVEHALQLVKFSDLKQQHLVEQYRNLAALQGNKWSLDGPQLQVARYELAWHYRQATGSDRSRHQRPQ